jgi:hypothetical protein
MFKEKLIFVSIIFKVILILRTNGFIEFTYKQTIVRFKLIEDYGLKVSNLKFRRFEPSIHQSQSSVQLFLIRS